ncbi:MAG: hypothetical protein WCK89_13170 [bacterium]
MKRIFLFAVVAGLGFQAMEAPGQTPPWYLATGLPVTDTDADGIPDAWEKRTFSDPAAADSSLDRDGDGLTDLEEFSFGSDPRTASTMGDGWSDKEKRDTGMDAVFRVTPAVSLAQWLGWLGWSAATWQTQTATTAEGFAYTYVNFVYNTQPYSAAGGTADFWLVTRTDRPAWLTVGDVRTTNSFPVRAGASRFHLRAAYGGPVALALDPHPGTLAGLPGASNGLWICEMRVEPFRTNTVVFSDGETPSVPGAPDSVDGLLLLTSSAGSAVHSLTSPPPRVTLQPLRMTACAAALGNGGWYCLCASEPSCDWPDYAMAGCDAVSMAMNGVDGGTPILSKEDARDIYAARYPSIECTVTQTLSNAVYPFIYGTVIFPFRQCEAHGGVSGAEQSLPLHEPEYSDYSLCNGIGCVCDGGPHWVVGFSHGLVNTRNLTHPEEAVNDKAIHHCLGVVWTNQPINLTNLCDSYGLNLGILAAWDADGKQLQSSALDPGAEPPDLEPTIFRVKMLQASNPNIVWDQMFIVVNNHNTKTRFAEWASAWSISTNRQWLQELPAAYGSLSNRVGSTEFYDPEPQETNLWAGITTPGKFYHHTSKYEMRSLPTIPNHYGHQTCYSTNGILVTTGAGAGTADFISPQYDKTSHRDIDVLPFIRAIQIDGNPCKGAPLATMIPAYLTHAIIYQGEHMGLYLYCRPPIPNERPILSPGTCP